MEEQRPFKITGEHLIRIFKDPAFVGNLRQIIEFGDAESGFDVSQLLFREDYDISPIEIGYSGSMEDSTCIRAEDLHHYPFEGSEKYLQDWYHLLGIHTHDAEDIRPSEDDFESLNKIRSSINRGFNTRPISIIASRFGNVAKMILLQEKCPIMFWEEIEDDVYKALDEIDASKAYEPQEIVAALKDTGLYNAEYIGLNSKGYNPGSLKKIAKFGFIPTVASGFYEESESMLTKEEIDGMAERIGLPESRE